MITRAPIFVDGLHCATNYINKKREHPKYLSAITWYNIVFKEEDLDGNNWMYIVKEPEEKINLQMKLLKNVRGWVTIFK